MERTILLKYLKI